MSVRWNNNVKPFGVVVSLRLVLHNDALHSVIELKLLISLMRYSV